MRMLLMTDERHHFWSERGVKKSGCAVWRLQVTGRRSSAAAAGIEEEEGRECLFQRGKNVPQQHGH